MRCFGAGLRMRLGEMQQIDAFRETVLPLQLLHQPVQHYEHGGPASALFFTTAKES